MAIENYIKVNDNWVLGDLVNGQPYKIVNTTNGAIREGNMYVDENNGLSIFGTLNEQITINGNPAIGKQPIYFVGNGQSITIVSDIVDSNNVQQTQIDSTSLGYPPVLVVPVMKYANKQVVDEVYFITTITNGVLSASGSLPSAGNWQMKTERVNDSLSAINADWKFSDASANFIVS